MTDIADQPNQAAKDQWQTSLYEAIYRFSVSLRELHETNPWPGDHPVLGQAINTLGTELWDRCFSLSEIRTAFEEAAADLPRYAGARELRP
jgi:hypothetical protein